MNALLKATYVSELRLATGAAARGDHEVSWHHLERAHILSQAYAWQHVWVHLRMLAAGWRRRDLHEVLGQLVRVVVAAPGSWLGRAPLGNTGGADVGIFAPMAIPDDIARVLAHREP